MELTKNGLTEASSNARILLLAENVTENGPAAVKIKWQFTFLYLVSLGTVWGNVFVCLAVYLERKLRNRFNLFLVSLAISDMLCAVLVMPISAWRMIYGKYYSKHNIE
ncbi:unnamed protein product [Protopolystoma xenopodis]|uniref:G-protein coupled receptors family 1 profile domain-containing protein n=1 Tax=Protopolystoma xenopodis TaxID=117903 RepID=A0A3S5B240_9PLAT|nr:unnamed protein product [Protopolystoma xenopodis]